MRQTCPSSETKMFLTQLNQRGKTISPESKKNILYTYSQYLYCLGKWLTHLAKLSCGKKLSSCNLDAGKWPNDSSCWRMQRWQQNSPTFYR